MAAPGGANQIARRVIDDLIEFSEETSLNALIAEMEALEDQGKLFDTLMDLRNDREATWIKLQGLNELITQTEQCHLFMFNVSFEWYGSILNILQGRNELLEKIIGCVVDSGGVPKLDPKVSDIWGIMETKANDPDHLVNYDNDNDIDDLGYESEVYLDKEEEEDENNHSNGNVVKRGITKLSKFHKEYGKPDGIKLSVTFDALNRISWSHKTLFSSFLGDLDREHIILKILSWKKVGSEARDKLWDEFTIKNKEIESDEEPPRGIMWLKGRVNKDGEFPDDEIRSVGDKLKKTEDKIKEGTLKVDHGTDAMTVVLGKEKEVMQEEWEVELHKRGIKCKTGGPLKKSNIVALGTVYKSAGKQMLHNQALPNDCYKVSIDSSLVDAACIPDVGNNGLKTVKDGVGGFFAWPKNQVVLDEEVTPQLRYKRLVITILHQNYNRSAKVMSLVKPCNDKLGRGRVISL
ncbi:hypothetical protein Tco_0948178 [Tanacetum coccineum]